MKTACRMMIVLLLAAVVSSAATPPALINYQGVLRDGAGAPRNGSFDMVFRFYSASSAGTLLLTDTHNTAAPSGPVAVSGGLFTARLGAGTIAAGSEPTLAEMFRDNAAVWVEIQVGTETLSPRVQVVASAYAQNATTLNGNDSSAFALTGHLHDATYVNEGQADSVTSAMIVNGTIALADLGQNGCGSGQVLKWNGAAWACSTDAGATDHGALTGLGDDDHPQYFSLAQNEIVSGIPAFNGGISGASAPFSVDSTFLVGSLNADLVDGLHASDLASSSHTHATLAAGTGLGGGSYNGGTAATFSVNYGTAAGTAVQGNQTGAITAGTGLTGGLSADALGDGFSATLNVGGGSGITANADNLALGPLTANWSQTGAFDIQLANASSELQILESAGGIYYGTFDVGDLAANQTYNFTTGGTVWTSGNDGTGSTLDADLVDGLHASDLAGANHMQTPAFGGTGLNTSGTAAGSLLYTAGVGTWATLTPGAGGTLLQSTGTGVQWASASSFEGDGVIGNEVINATNTTLTRSGSGTAVSPYTLALNLANANTWTGAQTFTANTNFPASGIWNTSGNVGIGTASPDRPLTIKGSSTNQLISLRDSTDVTQWHLNYNGGINFAESSAADYRLFLKDGGGVGIGTSTPGFPLTFPNVLGDKISLWGQSGDHYGFGIQSSLLQIYSGGSGADIAFGYGQSSTFTENMRIKGDGNVMIGTTTAKAKLTVQESLAVNGTLGDVMILEQKDGTVDYDCSGSALWQSWTNVLPNVYWTGVTLDSRSPNAGTAGSLTLKLFEGEGTGGALLAQQTITIPDSWDWHNFTISDPPLLQSGARYTVCMDPGAYNQHYWRQDSGNPYANGTCNWADCDMRFQIWIATSTGVGFKVNGNGSVGIRTENTQGYALAVNGTAAKTGGGSFSSLSDLRLKDLAGDYTPGLAEVVALRPYHYRYKEKTPLNIQSKGPFIGPVAQEIQKVIPEAVEEGTSGYLLVNNDPILWAVVNAVKELDARTQGLAGAAAGTTPTRTLKAAPKAIDGKTALSIDGVAPAADAAPATPPPGGELLEVSPEVQAGVVVVIVPDNGAALHPCYAAADPMVVGIATADAAAGWAPVAVGGIVQVRADATLFSIAKGDLLTTSAVPGHAMKAQPKVIDGEPIYRNGTVIGKALEPLESGTGLIKVLVMLR